MTVPLPSAADEPRQLPAALHDLPAGGETQTAVLAGGCFWGVQGVFQHVDGVLDATSGYAGGSAETATYMAVESGRTGHVEAVRVTFDPQKISFAKLLQIYFSAAHDPTQVDRQGLDVGPQYRSMIFPQDAAQASVAADYIAQLDAAHVYGAKIATVIEPGKPFYKAELFHQDFMVKHPTNPDIVLNEQPKVEALKKLFPGLYREKPVLVADRQG